MEGWKRVKATDRRGRPMIDHESPDGNWLAAEGYDEEARIERDEPWTLFERVKGKLQWRGSFRSLAAAKRAASKEAS